MKQNLMLQVIVVIKGYSRGKNKKAPWSQAAHGAFLPLNYPYGIDGGFHRITKLIISCSLAM